MRYCFWTPHDGRGTHTRPHTSNSSARCASTLSTLQERLHHFMCCSPARCQAQVKQSSSLQKRSSNEASGLPQHPASSGTSERAHPLVQPGTPECEQVKIELGSWNCTHALHAPLQAAGGKYIKVGELEPCQWYMQARSAHKLLPNPEETDKIVDCPRSRFGLVVRFHAFSKLWRGFLAYAFPR